MDQQQIVPMSLEEQQALQMKILANKSAREAKEPPPYEITTHDLHRALASLPGSRISSVEKRTKKADDEVDEILGNKSSGGGKSKVDLDF